jgi:hypothetical protein
MRIVSLFIALLMGHAVADYALQSDWMAKHKNRHVAPSFEPGTTTWPLVLAAHALVNGALVYSITGVVWLGVAETLAHGAIDFYRCESKYGIYPDQVMHILCKLAWSLAC